jgi:serine/threonine protein kinase
LTEQNILVRDLPPAPWWVKIGDFGISKRMEDTIQQTSIGGTSAFMAPELQGFTGEGEEHTVQTAYASDMWALGEITFQVFTRKESFAKVAMLSRYIHNIIPFPLHELEKVKASHMAQYFILLLMTPTPSSRPTVAQAIEHQWIKLRTPLPTDQPLK